MNMYTYPHIHNVSRYCFDLIYVQPFISVDSSNITDDDLSWSIHNKTNSSTKIFFFIEYYRNNYAIVGVAAALETQSGEFLVVLF